MNCVECPLFHLVKTLLLTEELEFVCDHNIERIKKIVSVQAGVSIKELESKSRQQHIVRARNIAMRKCRQEGLTLKRIGIAFNRSHSTVLYAVTQQEKKWATETYLKNNLT